MASPITKKSGIDNFDSRVPGTVEVWYYTRHAYIEHRTGRIVSNDGVPVNSQAFKIAMQIAKDTK